MANSKDTFIFAAVQQKIIDQYDLARYTHFKLECCAAI